MFNREEFKTDFIKQCSAENLSEDQILNRIEMLSSTVEKQAGLAELLRGIPEFYANAGQEGGISKGRAAAVIGLGATAAPFALGAAGGAAASKLKGNWVDDEDVKNKELIDELKLQTALAKQHQRLKIMSPVSI